MTDAEAVYTAQEAADKLTVSLEKMLNLVENMDDVPFGDVFKSMDVVGTEVYRSLTALAEVKSALSKIKVRETA